MQFQESTQSVPNNHEKLLTSLLERNKQLKSLLSSKQPICPHCLKEMKPVNYKGYYESFSYWECGCVKLPGGEDATGQ